MSEEFESLLNEKLAMREERGRSIGLREGRIEGRLEGKLEGRLEGKLEGRLEGQLEGKRTTATNLQKINMPVEQIAEIVEESLETVEQWLAGA